jgi:hypothetical protein
MGTGWRRALCTSVQRDDDDAKAKKRRPRDASPRAGGFFSSKAGGGSNPATPKLRCRTKPLQEPVEPAPVTPPSAPAAMRKPRMPLLQALSAPTSPSRFALLASLLPSKVTCILLFLSLDPNKIALFFLVQRGKGKQESIFLLLVFLFCSSCCWFLLLSTLFLN